MAETPARKRQLSALTSIILLLIPTAVGDLLEPVLGRCCAFGANWAREDLQPCASFPAPVVGVPAEHQSVCITAASICCLRYFRDEQCQKGKQVAQAGQECVGATGQGGEYFKDCCQGCRLGLVSGSMGMGCSLQFMFGFPWDNMFIQCCNQAAQTTAALTASSLDLTGETGVESGNLYPGVTSPVIIPGGGEDLCARFPGKLCAHVCVPTPGSYRCHCRAGFTLSADGKTCLQDTVTDRCHLNNPCAHKCRDTGISIECSCNPGYTLASDQRSCEDVDECAEKVDSCDWSTQTCINSVGSYRCVDRAPICDFGYQYDEEQRSCVDVDECRESPEVCEDSEMCVNTLGSYECRTHEDVTSHTCQPGFTFNSTRRVCMDIDECSDGTHDCSVLETCVNRHGDYTCEEVSEARNEVLNSTAYSRGDYEGSRDYEVVLAKRPGGGKRGKCPEGFRYNRRRRTCVDIDECASDPCGEGGFCENTEGSYSCECRLGYNKEPGEDYCTDVNECQVGTHTCLSNQRCDNTIGSFACIRMAGCGTGYTLNHNTGECDDVNECVVGGASSPCKRNERCINTLGSYICQQLLNCGAGYKMNEVGTQCIDIDECQEGTHQCEGTQVCSNRQGGYICQCPRGYRLNNDRQCQDINECESYYGSICSNNAVCENTPGSYRCNCKDGFKETNSGRSCVDVDECTEVEGICHHHCINVWGGYQCTCRAGYSLTPDNRTCEDINECEEARGRGRLCIGTCVNTPGSFSCSCPDGYTLAADGRTCKDVNECENGSVCRDSNEHCVNTRGGYKCNVLTCPENYVKDTRHKNRCKKATSYCLPGDEACHLQPLSYSYNFLPLVSNLTLPALGQVDLFTMRGPLWASTTVQFSLELEQVTAPAGVDQATRDFFYLKRTSFNQAVIALVKPILGPQDIQLALNMKLYQQGTYSGSAVAKLLIYVSQYDF